MALPIMLVAALAPPASATSDERIIGCSPPMDRPLRLAITQQLFLANGEKVHVVVTRDLSFSRDRDGLVVKAHIAALDTDDRLPGALDRLHLAYGRPGEVPITLHLDIAMAVTRIDSLDSLWQDFHRRQIDLANSMDHGRPGGRARAFSRTLDAMSVADRIALLSAFLKPVLRHCGMAMPAGARLQPDGTMETEIRMDAGDVRDASLYRVDLHSGLMRSLRRTVTSTGAPLRPMQEDWTLEPAP